MTAAFVSSVLLFRNATCFNQHENSRRILTATLPNHARIALRLQYNGQHFHGWESKPHLRTVESTLCNAISSIAKEPISVTAASRTDAGAHAAAQVVHFDAPERFANASAWTAALNKRLPSDVRVTHAAYASCDFDARRSAKWRRYRYSILTSSTPCVFRAPFSWHCYQHELDALLMHQAAQLLVSDTSRDLAAFRKARAPALHTQIRVHDASVRRVDDMVHIDVTADWFVYGMMRLLTATLLQVGAGKLSIHNFQRIVDKADREHVKFSAPAAGLCLQQVGYDVTVDPFGESVESGTELLRRYRSIAKDQRHD